MSIKQRGQTPEAEIRDFFSSWLKSVRAGDADGIRKHYADDIVAFDAVKQLQFMGRDAYMRHWSACLDMCPKPMIFEPAEVTVEAEDGLAFSHTLLKCGYVEDGGTEKTSWMRATTCYRKTGGRWAIVHEHFSAPFDMETCNAILDARP